MAFGIFIQPTYRTDRNQRIAMYAHKITGKFLLQRFQRFFNQDLLGCGANGDILVIGLQIDHLVNRHQFQITPLARAQMRTSAAGL